MQSIYKATKVFVPGGMPELTYNPRSERFLEQRLNRARENLCKLVTVTGSTKSGKTVLTSRVFPRANCVWIDGGAIANEDDFWTFILEELDAFTNTARSANKKATTGKGLEVTTGLPLFGGKVGANSASEQEQRREDSRSITPRVAAVRKLQEKECPLVIDDFHYIDRSFQGKIIRALKSLIFEGLPVILIAIPHRRYDAIKVEREITGRLENIEIPVWDVDELKEISEHGFPLLNLRVDSKVVNKLANEAYGSPHLMQEFCRQLCVINKIDTTLSKEVQISRISEELFRDVAKDTGKVVFDRLAKGPSQRSDRIQRALKQGGKKDIYKVVLLALKERAPGLEKIEYEDLRNAIRDVLTDNIPQAHEVSRVLEKMSEIAASDESSTPVLDWDKEERRLHITDPFFAFYLKWGNLISD